MNNTGLGKVNSNPMHSDKEQAQRTAKEQLRFIAHNWGAFCSVASKKDQKAAEDFLNMLKKRKSFYGKMTGYIDSLYEKTWRGIDKTLPENRKFGSYQGIKYGKHVNLKK